MKDFEISVRVRNNQLKQRREELGFTQAELSRRAGIQPSMYGVLESMKRCPQLPDGKWCKDAKRLAIFYNVPPEQLFPDSVMAIKRPEATRRMDAAELQFALEGGSRRMLDSPDVVAHKREQLRKINDAASVLAERSQLVLRRRQEGFTLEDIAEEIGRTRERVRQIEAQAMRRLRREILWNGEPREND